MKYCSKCGKEVSDEAVICLGCGCAVNGAKMSTPVGGGNKKIQKSMILGIIGIIFAWLFALVGHVVSIIGIIIGVKEYKETNKNTGLIISIIGEVCSIISSIIGVVALSGMYY